jgi:hypothetical protein
MAAIDRLTLDSNSAILFFVGSQIISVFGAILLLATDFAGWFYTSSSSGYRVDEWGYIGLLTPYFPLIAVLSCALLFCTYISFTALRNQEEEPDALVIGQAYRGSIAIFATVLLGALVFTVIMLLDEPDDWWLDSGFYRGMIGSLLTAIPLHLGLHQLSIGKH